MSANLTVVCGPAGSGKTEWLRHRYREELSGGRSGSVLWISPTQRGAFAARDKLLGDGLTACLSPGVTTFDQFAEAVLRHSPEPDWPINRLLKRRLIARLVRGAAAEGRLQYFGAIAETPGLIEMVCELISELKRAEIWPDEFRRGFRRGMTRKDRELADVYEAYQHCLTTHQIYDAEGRFWSAREILRQGLPRGFDRLRLIVVDGFTDFTRTQHEILELLSKHVRELYVSLPIDSQRSREDLFAKSLATLRGLAERHGELAIHEMDRPPSSDWPAFAHLERELFRNPRQASEADDTRGIEILAASRQLGEIESIGRRIKQLLVDGDSDDAGARIRPGDIAVVFRSLGDVASLVREAFDELGIPYALEAGEPLSRSPMLAALVNLLRLAIEDWPFGRLLSFVSSNYFQPAQPMWNDGQAAESAERLIRELQLPSGRKALITRIERRIMRYETPAHDHAGDTVSNETTAEVESKRRQAGEALALIRYLDSVLARLPHKATLSEWCNAIKHLIEELGFWRAVDAADDSRQAASDRRAWQRLEHAFRAEEELLERLGEPRWQCDMGEFTRQLLDAMHSEQVPPDVDETGRVRVLSATSVRTLDIPYLFIAGLSEKAFPRPDRGDRLYTDAEYQGLADAGLPLVLRAERRKEEMLLFYELLTRAKKRLFLSYPALDDKLEPLLASPYLIEVERALGPDRVKHRVQRDLSPLPQGDEPYSAPDLRLRAVDQALRGEPDSLALMLRDSAASPLGANVAAGLRVVKQRSRREGFGPFEGLIVGNSAIDRIAKAFGPDHDFSPSQIEGYARCPFRFFVERVLGVEPVEELDLATDHTKRGWLLHEALSAFHQRINAAHGGPATPAEVDPDEHRARFAEVLAELVERFPLDSPVKVALRDIDGRVILDWTQRYREQHEDYDANWRDFDEPFVPSHFEVSFGMPDPAGDPLSRAEPLTLGEGTNGIRIVGRIDRIDLGKIGGAAVFNLLDYKSDRTPKSANKMPETVDATVLQLDLYAIAAEELLFQQKMHAWQIGHWSVRRGGYKPFLIISGRQGSEIRHESYWPKRRRRVIETILALIESIRRGHFPVFSADKDCTSRCPFNMVCRIQQVRSLEKTWSVPSSNSD